MSFRQPIFLLSLLLIAVAIGVWLLAERRRARYAIRFTNLEVLASVTSARTWPRYIPPALFALALAALFVALARPQVSRTVGSERATVILVIDTSRSMQSKDVEPTRLGAAQQAVHTFLDRVPKRLRVGLVAFAGEAQVAAPPTTDHDLVGESVDEIGDFLIYGGTAIGDALQAAVELGKRALEQNPDAEGPIAAPNSSPDTRTLAASTMPPEPQKLVSILFLSDGAQTRGILQPLEGAQLAKDAGIPVYTIALGTPGGTVSRGGGFFGGPAPPGSAGQVIQVPPDPVTLKAIAELTGGRFSEARSAKALQSAYEKLGSSLGREPGKTEITFILVGIAAALLVAAGLLGVFLTPRLP
jgi:Ca-activated chloride channel family protein